MKKFVSAILSTTLILTSFASSYATEIKIDNKVISFTLESGQPFVDDSYRTQVPFRQTMEKFGATVNWNQETQTAIAEKDGIIVEAQIGKMFILKDGTQIQNDTAALIKDEHTYLPIRVVLEAFGAEVSWDEVSQIVTVLTDSSTNVFNDEIKIHFIDVGQGDSILIDYNDFEILIDAGPKSAGNTVSNYISQFVQGSLDVVVATHEHEDHIGGLPTIFTNYAVDKVFDNGRAAETPTYKKYIAAVSAEGARYFTRSDYQNMSVIFDDKKSFKILEMSGSFDDANNNSLIGLLSFGDVQTLFMGDAEAKLESENLSKFPEVEILKAGHHGSYTSSSSDFLNTVRPETVVVSAATGNTYKHPHLSVMRRFQMAEAEVYGTFKSGNIVAITDGKTYSFNTSTVITTADAGNGAPTGYNVQIR